MRPTVEAMTRWTDTDIPDLHGRTAVVTGANSGLGYQTALGLARHHAQVVMACRNQRKGAEALGRIRSEVPAADVTLASLDLSDLASVRQFAALFTESHPGLDILVNNAGVMAIPHQRTADGFEMQFGTNHLGHFALTGLLMPSLLARPGARVVTVSSIMHTIGRISFNDLQHERRYSKWLAYGQAKLANLLFAFELDRRARAGGADLLSVASHPGYASTNLQTAGPIMEGNAAQVRLMEIANRIIGQSDAHGAWPSLYGATAPAVVGGRFYGPELLLRGRPARALAKPLAHNRSTARRLWDVSEELTGVRFDKLDVA
jgi:NAD(P)-dependent dehydrogenase (short-subunit alcohol dehydrogenase family)